MWSERQDGETLDMVTEPSGSAEMHVLSRVALR